jgi:hypothetical protein
MVENVTVPNDLATGLENIGKTPGIDINRPVLNKIQQWAAACEFEEENIGDIARTEEFGKYRVTRERHHGNEDDISVSDNESYGSMLLSDFTEL